VSSAEKPTKPVDDPRADLVPITTRPALLMSLTRAAPANQDAVAAVS